MNDEVSLLLNRRRILIAALAGGGSAALTSCGSGSQVETVDGGDLWAGFDEKITERTLAEAE